MRRDGSSASRHLLSLAAKRQRRFSALVMLLSLWPGFLVAENVLVIVSADVPLSGLSEQEIAGLFLARRLGRDIDLTPVDRKEEELRDKFYRTTTGMSQNRLRAYWAKRVFTGRGRPPESVSLDEFPDVLAGHGPVISYTAPGSIPSGMKGIHELEPEPGN